MWWTPGRRRSSSSRFVRARTASGIWTRRRPRLEQRMRQSLAGRTVGCVTDNCCRTCWPRAPARSRNARHLMNALAENCLGVRGHEAAGGSGLVLLATADVLCFGPDVLGLLADPGGEAQQPAGDDA